MRRKAQMTVYLSLILTVFISCTLTVLEAARRRAMEAQSEVAVYMALDSVFSEYHQGVYERYGLFMIDTSYGMDTGSFQNTENRLREYLDYNLEPTKGVLAILDKDFYRLGYERAEIEKMRLVTDDEGASFMKQAAMSVKQRYGVEYLMRFQNLFEVCETNGLRNIDLEAELIRQKEACRALVEEDTIADKIWNHELITGTEARKKEIKWRGILPFILKDESGISKYSVDLSQLASRRTLNRGTGRDENVNTDIIDTLLFNEYLLENMGDYSRDKKDTCLTYQTEYIIIGDENDTVNLRRVANAIYFIREGANYVAIRSDSSKTAVTDFLGTAICTLFGYPDAGKYLSEAFKIIWAVGESVCDMRAIYQGKKVPLLKQPDQWTLGIEQLLTLEGVAPVTDENAWNSLGYRDYLRLLLLTVPQKDRVLRSMDIIEMDIRTFGGDANFRIDECADYIQVSVRLVSGYGYRYMMKKEYGYYR